MWGFFKKGKSAKDAKPAEPQQTPASGAEPVAPPAAAAPQPEPVVERPVPVVPEAEPAPAEPAKKGWFARLKEGLSRTRGGMTEGLASLFLGKKQIDDELLEELETRLLMADVGVEATGRILAGVTERLGRKQLKDVQALFEALRDNMAGILRPVSKPLEIDSAHRPFVVLVVGVNGAGKTTTIGKLAAKFRLDGKRVLLGAADTFRAAATEQLEVWAERAEVPVVTGPEGSDPGAVAFDAVSRGVREEFDVVIVDTAGRLHTKSPLMEELKKVRRVMGKAREGAPDEILLVLDATMGQNAIQQARQFHEALGVTGIALTKLDGTAKGGVVIGIADEFQIPVRLVGVGESLADLRPFDPREYVTALFGREES